MASGLIAPAVVELGLVTYRAVKSGSATTNPVPYLPLPSQYGSVAVVYGLLGVLPERAERVAAMVGWGFVVATLLNLWTPGGQVTQVQGLKSATENGAGNAHAPIITGNPKLSASLKKVVPGIDKLIHPTNPLRP